jgi:hypothetical protein
MSALPGRPLLRLATPHARSKGHSPWIPKSDTIQGRLLADALEVLERYRNHLPLGPRAILYQLLPLWVPMYYESKDKLRSALGDVLGKARRAEIIPWESIDDRRTAMAAPFTFHQLPDVYEQMQANRQAGQPYRIEVWVEAAGNLSRIGDICKPYGITVYSGSVPCRSKPTGRQRSASAIRWHSSANRRCS